MSLGTEEALLDSELCDKVVVELDFSSDSSSETSINGGSNIKWAVPELELLLFTITGVSGTISRVVWASCTVTEVCEAGVDLPDSVMGKT